MAGRRIRRTNDRASSRGRTSPDNLDRDALTDRIADLLGPAARAGARGKTTVRDPRQLKPAELCRVLNSTPLGTCINERRLYAHRSAAGTRILSTVPGAGATKGRSRSKPIDLLRYAAWLAGERHMTAGQPTAAPNARGTPGRTTRPTPPPTQEDRASSGTAATPPPGIGLAGYEAHKERARARQADLSRSGRDIGEIPAIVDPERRERCRLKFRLFCEQYFPARFNMGWSPDHLRVIDRIEQAVIQGDLMALGMPRGSGKTTIIETAIIWALAYGHRRFVAAIGADKPSAVDIVDSIQTEFETNDLLAQDFPEVCYPIARLEGITQRAHGQLCDGERTRMSWCQDQIILPTIKGSAASGAIVKVAGITGRIRGMKHTLADGSIIRPDLVLVDDPQTDESAHSPQQVARRENTLAGAILGLAGPGKRIAGFAAVTIIAKDDMADRLLDRKRHPEWRGETCKMVYEFPTNTQLWDQYAEIFLEGLRSEDNEAANAFYRKHRKAMDAGARVAWEDRKYDDELSALQHAMNLRIRDESAFFAEYQNEPRDADPNAAQRLSIEALEKKISGVDRGVVPLAAHQAVAFIDVQDKLLWWVAMAFGEAFTGAIIDCGAWPEQGRMYFTNRDARRTLARAHVGAGFEGKLFAGLSDLVGSLTARTFRNESGTDIPLTRILIDANWGKSTDIVYQFARETEHRSIVLPSHGRGITGDQKPLNEYEKRPGDQVGHNWRIPAASKKRASRYVVWDTNYWKSQVAERFRLAPADRGSVGFFKATPTAHRMLFEHMTSEYPVPVTGRGRTVDTWKLSPGRDNHLWDCVVGSFVAASIAGVTAVGHKPSKRKRKRVKLSELQQRRTT